MIKCLRALSLPFAAEHSAPGDVMLAAPGELLSIPRHSCRQKKNPDCMCRKVFVGIHSGQPSMLARVCVGEAEDILHEGAHSSSIGDLDDEDACNGVVLHGLEGVAYALRNFEVGTLLRIHRTAGAVYLKNTWEAAVEETVEI